MLRSQDENVSVELDPCEPGEPIEDQQDKWSFYHDVLIGDED